MYRIETISLLQSENSCWICQVLVASTIYAFDVRKHGIYREFANMGLKLPEEAIERAHRVEKGRRGRRRRRGYGGHKATGNC